MINPEKLKPVLNGYKSYFPAHWSVEKYKWEAVKHFQDHWDINADDFGAMFKQATDKTKNLLASGYAYPRGMITNFAQADNEATRAMFLHLYDESIDLATRVEAFKTAAETLRIKYDDGNWRNHYQNTNAISTYLWLRYPDRYYIYKYELYRAASTELESDYIPKRNGSADSMVDGFRMYDEICSIIRSDPDIKELLQNALTPSCYPDPEMRTMTIDVGFYLARFYLLKKDQNQEEKEWFPKNYTPGLSVDDWKTLLADPAIFTQNSLQIMKRMKDYGGQATCSQLSIKYGENRNFYNTGSSTLAKRIAEAIKCDLPPARKDDATHWWPILYQGKQASDNEPGSYIWRLRPELSQALEDCDLSHIELYAQPKDLSSKKQYWWLTANPKIWRFADIKVGEEQSYTLYNKNGNKRRVFKNFLDAKAGDIIIGYEANPVKKVVALAKVSRENDGEAFYFEKTENLTTFIDYKTLKESPELAKMEFFIQPNGSLFKLTEGEYEFIMDFIREENPLKHPETTKTVYTREDFLSAVYMTEERLNILEMLLRDKKNIILQGAPGVGKTFAAKKLAYVMMGEKDESRIKMVQFHQNYSYEDFVLGYRPEGEGFELKEGVFYRFCQTAANHPEKEYFFIIDEINRGNLSKIFGELLMLIEKDYRDTRITLAYNDMSFYVPENLFIIGMMNTADRSLAMIDFALRRRFSFFEMEPGFSSDGFIAYQKSLANETFDALIEQIKLLNNDISKDDSLGRGFQIGHSYFCGKKSAECSEDWMRSIVEFDIIPMLSEYWFDDAKKLQKWENNLRGVFDD